MMPFGAGQAMARRAVAMLLMVLTVSADHAPPVTEEYALHPLLSLYLSLPLSREVHPHECASCLQTRP